MFIFLKQTSLNGQETDGADLIKFNSSVFSLFCLFSQTVPVCSTNHSLCINLPTSRVYRTLVHTWVSLPLHAVLELNLSYTNASPLWIEAKADVYLLRCKRQWCTRRNWQLRIGPPSNHSNEGISSQKMNFSWPFDQSITPQRAIM